MVRQPYGVASKHVGTSKGADTDAMKFYCTQYGTTYGSKWSKFQPRNGKHTGTGYLSNFRPGVYYNSRLDELDNPPVGRMISDNYESVTKKSFIPYIGPSGKESLPNSTKQIGSGYIREKPLTIPTENEVMSVCGDTRLASAPAGISPHHKPYLHKIRPKAPVESENAGYGPRYMSTETSQQFQGRKPDRSQAPQNSVGPKGGSGFTNAYNIEPVTFHPDYYHKGDVPGWLTDRPTGVSIMKTHFLPSENAKGNEILPKLANRSVRETGFTSSTKAKPVFVNNVMKDAYDNSDNIPAARLKRVSKEDPAEYLNMTHPDNYSSIAKDTFQGKQRPRASESDRLGNTSVGNKEITGYSQNNDSYVMKSDNPARFITHYQTRFLDTTPKGLDREGHTWGGIQPQQEDGFTRSTAVHDMGPTINSTATLRNLHPYVATSIKARDTFYDDHKFDGKFHSTNDKSVAFAY